MTQIVGTGGKVAEVDEENRLRTFSVSQAEDKHINTEGGVFTAFFSQSATGAGDYFFYLKNEGIKDLYITDIRVKSDSPTELLYEHVTGNAVFSDNAGAGNVVQTATRKLGSASQVDATVISDSNITGLTSLGVIFFEECPAADTRYSLRTSSNIIILQGQAIAFRRVAAAGEITAAVSIVVSE